MAMADEGKFAKLIDGALARLNRQPPPKRPPVDNGDDLRVDQLRRVRFADRVQHLRDPAGAFCAEEEVHRRRRIEHYHRKLSCRPAHG